MKSKSIGAFMVFLGWLFSAMASPHTSHAGSFTVFGPEDFVRTTTKPEEATRYFNVRDPDAPYAIHINNGGNNHQFESNVTSAAIKLNQSKIIKPNEFNQNIFYIERPVKLSENNTLAVELRSRPESGMTIEVIGFDDTPPTIVASVSPQPNAAGWCNTEVTVSFACSDTTSGVAFCSDPVVVTQEGADQVITGTAIDVAGNSVSTSVSVNLDLTPPDITITSPLPGANLQNSPAVVQGSIDDALSGIATVTCNNIAAAWSVSSFACEVPLSEGENTIDAQAVDLAGNISNSNLIVTFAPPALELAYVDDMTLAWQDAGSGGTFDGKYSQPLIPAGFFSLGSFGQTHYGPISGFVYVAKPLSEDTLASPVDYEWIYSDWGSGADLDGSFWKPIPPEGYVCLGVLAQSGYAKPSTEAMKCVRQDLTVPAKLGNTIWIDFGTGADYYFGSWQIIPADENGIFLGTFTGSGGTNASAWTPPTEQLFTIDARRVKRYELDEAVVEELVQQYGPNLYLYPATWNPLIPGESYFPDDPAFVLDNGMKLEWGLVQNETDYDSFSFSFPPLGSIYTSAESLMQDVESYVKTSLELNDPSFRYYIQVDDDLKSGNLERAKAFVRVRSWNWLATELQFWFYYPYNGPGRAEVCASGNWCDIQFFSELGRHYGDWEHVTLRVDNRTKQLISVYMSRHAQGQWISRSCFSNALQFDGTNPRIYSAMHSHANYPNVGSHDYMRAWSKSYGLGTASVDLRDLTSADGEVLNSSLPGKHNIISSDLPEYQASGPPWLEFQGRWGKFERLADDFKIPGTPIPVYTYTEVGAGPSGPAMKRSWTRGDSGQNWWWTGYRESNEVCFDTIDNDGDGLIDCLDPDCGARDPVCLLECLKSNDFLQCNAQWYGSDGCW